MKYYKKNDAIDLIAHNKRETIPEYVIDNPELNICKKNWDDSLENMIAVANEDARKNTKTKALKKNGNVFLDGVLAFSRSHVEYLYDKYGEEKTNSLLVEYSEMFGREIQKKFGMQLVQVALHLDEGNIKDGEMEKNYHAHISFLNYDFASHHTVLRTLQKSKKDIEKNDFVTMQDMAGGVFAPLDFLRGEEGSKKKHLEREEYIKFAKEIENLKSEIKKKDQILSQKSNSLIEKNVKISRLEVEIGKLKIVESAKKITIKEFDKKIRALEKTSRALDKEIKRYDDTNIGQYFKKLKMDFKEFRKSKKKIKKQVSVFKSEEIEVIEAGDIEPLYVLLNKIFNEYKHLLKLSVDYNKNMNEYNHISQNYELLDGNYQKILADHNIQNEQIADLILENTKLKSLLPPVNQSEQAIDANFQP